MKQPKKHKRALLYKFCLLSARWASLVDVYGLAHPASTAGDSKCYHETAASCKHVRGSG